MLKKYKNLEGELNTQFINRADEIKALILAHISSTHVVMLGEPGTGKSFLARKFAEAFPSDSDKVPFFEVSLNAFSKPEEVFGPVDIKSWKETSSLVYKSENFLPNARIAFLDELSRGEAVINSLLTILNERTFTVNGKAVDVPLEMAISATNFKFSSNEFEAMRDRFLQWLTPKKVSLDSESLFDLWTSEEVTIKTKISEKELLKVRKEFSEVVINKETLEALRKVLQELSEDHGIFVSDRRAKAIVQKLIRASAWYDGRKETSTDDLENIWTALWTSEEQISTVKRVLQKNVNPEKCTLDEIFESSQLLMGEFNQNKIEATLVAEQFKSWAIFLSEMKVSEKNKSHHRLCQTLIEKFREKVASIMVQRAQMTSA